MLLDEQASQILAMTDEIAERGRKLGGTTIRSIGDIARRQRLADHDIETAVTAIQMFEELRRDNVLMNGHLYEVHESCDQHKDAATASLIEVWIDQTEQFNEYVITSDRWLSASLLFCPKKVPCRRARRHGLPAQLRGEAGCSKTTVRHVERAAGDADGLAFR